MRVDVAGGGVRSAYASPGFETALARLLNQRRRVSSTSGVRSAYVSPGFETALARLLNQRWRAVGVRLAFSMVEEGAQRLSRNPVR